MGARRRLLEPLVLGTILAIAISSGRAEGASTSRPIRPDAFLEALELKVEGKTFSYWSLDGTRPLVLTVRGPGRVRLITRLAQDDPDGEGSYEIVVRQGIEVVARSSFRVLPATLVEGGDVPAWGRHRNVTFRVPPGTHTYRVELGGDRSGVVAARPRFLPPRRSRRRVSITPETYGRVLTLIRDEKEISYYLLTPDAPLKAEILGPTELQVSSRLDFDRDMKGGLHGYALEIAEGGETIRQISYEVTRSQVAAWRDRPEIVPGVVKSVRVPLGEGLHELEIRLTNTVARGVAVKLYLPAEDVN
jgi:hypothetical protein